MKYRKELDGLRALAVIPVVVYHAKIEIFGVHLFSGGFFGVDIFFVLSGYLITSILINEMTSGTFSIMKFYERRARRIMPALFFVIAVCIPFSYKLLLPDALSGFFKSLIAVSVFCSNILFSSENNYFSSNVDLKPLLHTWSLAVEEQYYLFFPIILLTIWRFGRKAVTILLISITIASLFHANTQSITDQTYSFYSLTTRSWELLVGSIVSIYLSSGNNLNTDSVVAKVGGIFGIALILFSMLFFNKTIPHPSFYTLIPTLGAALIIIFSSKNDLSGKLLSIKFFVITGGMSYSIYLWHHPIFSFARNIYNSEPSAGTMLLLILLTLVLSYISWRYIEAPFRRKEEFSRRFIFTMTVLGSAFFISIGVLGIKTNLLSGGVSDNSKYDQKLTNRLRGNAGISIKCEKSFSNEKDCNTSETPEIMLWGDSFAMHLATGILASNPNVKMTQATVSQCAPILGISSSSSVFGAQNCIDSNSRIYDTLKNTPSIKYVVLASPFTQLYADDLYLLDTGETQRLSGEFVFTKFKETINKIRELGVKVTVVAPPPEGGFEIGLCLHKVKLSNAPLTQCDFPLEQMPESQKKIYSVLALLEPDVNIIWLQNGICINGQCYASIGDTMIYRDYGHLSYEGSEELGVRMNFYKLITNK